MEIKTVWQKRTCCYNSEIQNMVYPLWGSVPSVWWPKHKTIERRQQRTAEFVRQQIKQSFFGRRFNTAANQQPTSTPLTVSKELSLWCDKRTPIKK